MAVSLTYSITVENIMIPLADGCEIFCRLVRPVTDEPIPGILMATPYGASAGVGNAEHSMLEYLGHNGYASAEIDLRGSQNSGGSSQAEYAPQEQEDLVEIIGWIAAQPWCTGRVGMRGISWSGFNSLQVAARRPPELQAIVSACATDDRYADGEQFLGGCVLASDHLWWSNFYLAVQACPPEGDQDDRWRDGWLERLDQLKPAADDWLEHLTRDDFWKHGSVCEDWSAIECPVLIFGGWADGFRRAAMRTLAHVERSWAVIGPWAHVYPYQAKLGPPVTARYELRWWDRWLRDAPNGVEKDPSLRAFIIDPRAPRPVPKDEPGRWVAVRDWPRDADMLRVELTREQLSFPEASASVELSSPQDTGTFAPPWCLESVEPHEHPLDQRVEDGRSLCFTTAPLTDDIDILGSPEVDLTVSSTEAQALIAVRLCRVAPDGTSNLLAIGVLNLTHRDGHEAPSPLIPGQAYRVNVQLRAIGARVPAGHRLRLALATSYWPYVWPSPRAAVLTLSLEDRITVGIPTLPTSHHEIQLDLPNPEQGEPEVARTWRRSDVGREMTVDFASGHCRLTWQECGVTYDIDPADPLSARVETQTIREARDGSWRLSTRSVMTSDEHHFHTGTELSAWTKGELVFTRSFSSTHSRDLV